MSRATPSSRPRRTRRPCTRRPLARPARAGSAPCSRNRRAARVRPGSALEQRAELRAETGGEAILQRVALERLQRVFLVVLEERQDLLRGGLVDADVGDHLLDELFHAQTIANNPAACVCCVF